MLCGFDCVWFLLWRAGVALRSCGFGFYGFKFYCDCGGFCVCVVR